MKNPLMALAGLWPRPAQKTSLRELKEIAAIRQAGRLRARYDVAQTTTDNKNHWANADNLSARAANSLAVRRTLRTRSRYEVANNSYAAGMMLTLSNDIVGSGPRLQIQTPDSDYNSLVEREFAAWQRDVRFGQKLRTMCVSKPRDGEGIARLTSNPNHESPVWLDWELIETDQMTTPALVPTRDHVDGIWFDAYQQPKFYDILDQHPGDLDQAPMNLIPRQIPAANMIHWFREDRPGQKRGIPEIMSALPLFAQLRRYTLAVIAAAETAADFAAVISSQMDPDEGDDVAAPFSELDISARMLLTLPNKMQLQQLKAEQPATTYGDFKHEILSEIGRVLCMPRNIILGDSSNYNYSSGRLDRQLYFKSIGITQVDCEATVLDRLFREWYREAVLLGIAEPIDLRLRPWSWSWDPAEDLDPTKSARARVEALQSGALSYQRLFGELGLDWQVEQQQQAEALGLTLDEYRKLLVQKLFVTKASTANPNGVDPLSARRRKHLSSSSRRTSV
jgi:capsid protein